MSEQAVLPPLENHYTDSREVLAVVPSIGEVPIANNVQELDYSLIPGAHVTRLQGETANIGTADGTEMQNADNETQAMRQALLAVIRVGGIKGNTLSVVKVQNKDCEAFMVTQMPDDPAERATIVGFFDKDTPLKVGRGSSPGTKLSDDVSREHLALTVRGDGMVAIEDVGTTNGTEVITYSKERADAERSSQAKLAVRGLSRFMPMRKTPNQQAGSDLFVETYIEKLNAWAPKSEKVKNELDTFLAPQPKTEAEWSYTSTPQEMAQFRKELAGTFNKLYEEPAGPEYEGERYGGRPVIKRDSPIEGGVYIVPQIQEAIVVSETIMRENATSPERVNEYDQVYTLFKSELSQITQDHSQNASPDRAAVRAAFNVVDKALKYDKEYADNQSKIYADKKINLAENISDGKGVCRHQALLVAYLLERATKAGTLNGKVSVDRNYIPGKGGHAWARYTSEQGEVHIVDVAQNFVGTLESSERQASTWSYARPKA